VWSRPTQRRIDQNFVRTIDTLTHADTELLLSYTALSEEIPIGDFLQRIVGFNIEQFTDSGSDALSPWNGIEIRPRVPRLL
jgi:hypothetical protein